MSSAYLSDFIANAEDDLALLIPAALRGQLDFKGLHKLCNRFRQRGACTFLMTGDPRPFFVNAMQSAGAYLALLQGVPDVQKATSESRPFYDAVAGEFWDCAGGIARTSRQTWNKTKEYEDDFLFMLFLMKHFFLGATDVECRAIVAAHDTAAEGNDQSHRDVCLAFLDRDGPRFDDALTQILAARAARVEAMVERDAIPEESWSWLRYFSSEGLALVKLADRVGLPIGKDYLHVSEGLRRTAHLAFDPDAWRQVPLPVAPR